MECVGELKLIAELIEARGIAGMREAISNTAELGAVLGGPRIVDDGVRSPVRASLDEIRAGRFSAMLSDEEASAYPRLRAARARARALRVEQARRENCSVSRRFRVTPFTPVHRPTRARYRHAGGDGEPPRPRDRPRPAQVRPLRRRAARNSFCRDHRDPSPAKTNGRTSIVRGQCPAGKGRPAFQAPLACSRLEAGADG